MQFNLSLTFSAATILSSGGQLLWAVFLPGLLKLEPG